MGHSIGCRFRLAIPCFVVAFLCLGHVATVLSHEGHGREAGAAAAESTEAIGSALVLPAIEGPKPWSSKPVLDDPQRFSIAILTDRTGGHRPGVWMKAVERVNWLRPDFVVSVGDLIEGYTEDESEIQSQWAEFLGFIDQLQMKFFFVAGNHDVTNPTLHRIWREKFGKEWYSFDYKGVHFVCLLSEDPTARLGDEQLEWLNQDLQAHRDARWTLVFLHKPLWTYAESELAAGNPDPTNWKRVEAMLADRPHTVFAGHVHHYVQYQRNSQHYYSLATTGGSSRLRGVPYGEFDHITWLTMEQDGPRVANLLLDGIQPANVVTEESIEGFREFLAEVRIEVEPLLVSDDELGRGEIRLTVTNQYQSAVAFEGTIHGLPLVGLDMKSQTIQMDIGAGETLRQVIPFSMKEPVDLQRFRLTSLTAKVVSQQEKPLTAEWTLPVVIDREYQIFSSTPTIDGDLQDWKATWWETDPSPVLAGSVENWNGPADGSFKIAASYDDEHMYFAVVVEDEKVIDGDQFTIAMDPRALLERLERNRLGRETVAMVVQAPSSESRQECSVSGIGRGSQSNLRAFGRRTAAGYEFECSVPLRNVIAAQGTDWTSVQLGARLTDVDSSEERPVEVLWRASEIPTENRAFAHAIRK